MDRKTELSSYRTRLLTDAQWARLSADALPLVERALEGRPYKLKQQHLTSLVKLAVWRGPLIDSWRLDDLLTDAAVEAFLGHLVGEGVPPNTLQNHRTRLGRLLRVHAGLPRLARTARPPSGPAPYSDADLATLVDAAPDGLRDDVARAILLGVGAGLGPPEWYDAEIVRCDPDRWLVEVDGDRRPLVVPAGIEVPVGRLTRDGWSAVLAWAATVDGVVVLDRHRLVASFVARAVMSPARTAAGWIRTFQISRGAIERALPHVGDVDPDETARWLRGA